MENENFKVSDIVKLTNEQKEMLQMSEDDIDKGQLISQEQMNKRNLKWLNAIRTPQTPHKQYSPAKHPKALSFYPSTIHSL